MPRAEADAKTAVVSLHQGQRRIYPLAVSGRFAAWRWAACVLRAALAGMERARRLCVFGPFLYPQDVTTRLQGGCRARPCRAGSPGGTGEIENVYRLQPMNATGQPQRCRVGVEGLAGTVVVEPGAAVEVDAPQARWMPVAPEAAMALGGGVHELRFRIEQMVPRAKAVAADPSRNPPLSCRVDALCVRGRPDRSSIPHGSQNR